MARVKSELHVYVSQYVTQTVEVESADAHKALAELQEKNGGLQEQVTVQRQLLRELESQLHDSQRTCTQLRTQVTQTIPLTLTLSFRFGPGVVQFYS